MRNVCQGMPGRKVLVGSREGACSPVPHPQIPPGCPHCPAPLSTQKPPATGLQMWTRSQVCLMLDKQLAVGCLVCRVSREHAMVAEAASCSDVALGLR